MKKLKNNSRSRFLKPQPARASLSVCSCNIAIYKTHQCTCIHKCARQTLFEILYVLDIIKSPVIKQMVHLIFVHNPLFIYRIQFLLSKTYDPPLAATEVGQNLS